ncbi:MAG TPA: hypothetical protein VEA44_15920 [Caulobacter sp.]|nr:hypothetical protein [Caulobacter sp.]
MRRSTIALACATLIAAAPTAAPAAKPLPTVQTFDIAEVLSDPKLMEEAPKGVKFYFGDQKANVVKVIGPLKGSRRTGRKSPPESCRKVMASLMGALGRDVQARGGNALVGIKSNLFNIPTSSDTQFQCALGEKKVSVALTGQIAVVE